MSIEELKDVDIRTVEPESLVDILEISISEELPTEERVAEFVKQVRNPYCFRIGNVVVKNVYSNDGVSLRDRFVQYVRTL